MIATMFVAAAIFWYFIGSRLIRDEQWGGLTGRVVAAIVCLLMFFLFMIAAAVAVIWDLTN